MPFSGRLLNCVFNVWTSNIDIGMYAMIIENSPCVGKTECEKSVETILITKKSVAKVSANEVQ